MSAISNYALYLVLSGAMMLAFFKIYTFMTPWNEFLLIRQGNTAACLSLSGALIGFSLTIASCIIHTANLPNFLMWSAAALVVQALAFLIASTLLKNSQEHIEAGNNAFGGLMGAISLAVGAINAACIS